MKIITLFVIALLFGTVLIFGTPVKAVECTGVPGDVNNDGRVTLSDYLYLYQYLWNGGPEPPCPDQADMNCSGNITISDYLYLYNYLFMGGPAPMDCGA
ncbi:MAG: dockerin type I repeat-containing protein [Candidatus Zixiibacteriota bacterium]